MTIAVDWDVKHQTKQNMESLAPVKSRLESAAMINGYKYHNNLKKKAYWRTDKSPAAEESGEVESLAAWTSD